MNKALCFKTNVASFQLFSNNRVLYQEWATIPRGLARISEQAFWNPQDAGTVRDAPDQIIYESWFKGPFQLVPETQANTFAHTTLQIAAKLEAAATATQP